jgi:Integrase core domain
MVRRLAYIPMAKGFLYLVVVMDWVSRAILAWRLSNTLGAEFCVEAAEEALFRHGRPEIFNTDQEFTSDDFTGTLERHGPRGHDQHQLGFINHSPFPDGRLPSVDAGIIYRPISCRIPRRESGPVAENQDFLRCPHP